MNYDRLEAEWGFTDQEREAYEYEEAARYDQHDGLSFIDPVYEQACEDAMLNENIPVDDIPF